MQPSHRVWKGSQFPLLQSETIERLELESSSPDFLKKMDGSDHNLCRLLLARVNGMTSSLDMLEFDLSSKLPLAACEIASFFHS